MERKRYPARPILSVDDEAGVLMSLKVTLRQAGMNNVDTCQDSRQVLAMLSRQAPEVILLDLYMPHIPGEELLTRITREHPGIPVIVITGASDVETAVRCMKSGAFDYLTKPVETGPLIAAVNRAIEMRALQRENETLKAHLLSEEPAQPGAFRNIISINRRMLSIFQYLNAIAVTLKPLLITGETGTGKELAAQAVHGASGRSGALVVVNVGGLSDSMFEDTLFGHVRGAYTGAEAARPGMIEKASGGTLVLDEIGDLTPGSQAKLLRLLQSGEYQHLGEDRVKVSDARIIALTNKDLWSMQAEGTFRKDLIFRLKTHHVHLPALRDRHEDLALLVDHFMEQASRQLGKSKPTAPKELLTLLAAYDFPGNIRELQTMIFDALSMHSTKILSLSRIRKHVSQGLHPGGANRPGQPSGEQVLFPTQLPPLKQIGDILVDEAMRRARGNQSVAATMLGISPAAISKRLKKQKAKIPT
jgi:DNA-binding NtrC family response regulator